MRRICPGVMFRTYLTMRDTVASACGGNVEKVGVAPDPK